MTFPVDRSGSLPLRTGVDLVEQLVAAGQARCFLDCRSGDGASDVPADAVRRATVIVGQNVDGYGVRLANASITGAMDLSAMRVLVPMHFASCIFAEVPRFDGADLHELFITDGVHGGSAPEAVLGVSRLPGLLGSGLRMRRDLQLSGSIITGAHSLPTSLSRTSAVWLTEAQIGGRLLAIGTKIHASGDRAMQCDRTRVDGDVRLIHGFATDQEVRLLAMHLGGSLDLTASSLSSRSGRALDLSEATIGGSLFLLDDPDLPDRLRVEGRIEMGRAVINGRLLIRNADLIAP